VERFVCTGLQSRRYFSGQANLNGGCRETSRPQTLTLTLTLATTSDIMSGSESFRRPYRGRNAGAVWETKACGADSLAPAQNPPSSTSSRSSPTQLRSTSILRRPTRPSRPPSRPRLSRPRMTTRMSLRRTTPPVEDTTLMSSESSERAPNLLDALEADQLSVRPLTLVRARCDVRPINV
jgi:hypothetical protein